MWFLRGLSAGGRDPWNYGCSCPQIRRFIPAEAWFPDRRACVLCRHGIRFTICRGAADLGSIMDKFWSVFTMPIGMTLCFGPALLVWWVTRDKGVAARGKSSKRP